MNKYTLQRVRLIRETIDEYIVIDDLKLQEICEELDIDFADVSGGILTDSEMDDLWQACEEWESPQQFHVDGEIGRAHV